MNRKRMAGVVCLLLATVGAIAAARPFLMTEIRVTAQARPSEEGRTALWDYFSAHYSEGNCSAVYTDLTHDGAEELVVLEVETAHAPILIHDSRPDMEQVTGGTVTVLDWDSGGTVKPIFSHTLNPGEAGGLYLQKQDGLVYLLWCTEEGEKQFFLSENGDCLAGEESSAEGTQEPKPLLVFPPAEQADAQIEYLDELFTTY